MWHYHFNRGGWGTLGSLWPQSNIFMFCVCLVFRWARPVHDRSDPRKYGWQSWGQIQRPSAGSQRGERGRLLTWAGSGEDQDGGRQRHVPSGWPGNRQALPEQTDEDRSVVGHNQAPPSQPTHHQHEQRAWWIWLPAPRGAQARRQGRDQHNHFNITLASNNIIDLQSAETTVLTVCSLTLFRSLHQGHRQRQPSRESMSEGHGQTRGRGRRRGGGLQPWAGGEEDQAEWQQLLPLGGGQRNRSNVSAGEFRKTPSSLRASCRRCIQCPVMSHTGESVSDAFLGGDEGNQLSTQLHRGHQHTCYCPTIHSCPGAQA